MVLNINILIRIAPLLICACPLFLYGGWFSSKHDAQEQPTSSQTIKDEQTKTETSYQTNSSKETYKVPGLEGTIHIHNNNHNKNHNHIYNAPSMSSQFFASQYTTIATNITNNVVTTFNQLQKKAEGYLATLDIQKIKKWFIITSLIIGSATLWWHIFSITRFVLSDDGWGAWKKDTPGEMLVTSTLSELTVELLHDIQRTYMSLEEPGNFMQPLYQCFKDIDYENGILKELLYIGPWLVRFRLEYYTSINELFMVRVKDRMARLMFVKKLLIDWLSHYHVSLMSQPQITPLAGHAK